MTCARLADALQQDQIELKTVCKIADTHTLPRGPLKTLDSPSILMWPRIASRSPHLPFRGC